MYMAPEQAHGSKLDQRACPKCGITFYEFRNQGRLGCPHDYTCFAKELEPLLVNIHGEINHAGKRLLYSDALWQELSHLNSADIITSRSSMTSTCVSPHVLR